MRGRGHKRKARKLPVAGSPTEHREALERRWHRRLTDRPQWADLVTGQSLSTEPFHRWLPYKLAFAPELVRTFLVEAQHVQPGTTALPLLDPFAGVGTFAIECARQRRAAIGIEALESLAFLATVRGATEVPALPDLTGCGSWEQAADRLIEPIHRAALIYAVVRQHTSTGRPDRSAAPLLDLLERVTEMIRQDLRQPLAAPPRVDQGDARRLEGIADASIAGILTSPPYLSRHDYTQTTRPHEMVYRYWYSGRDLQQRRRDQVRAHPKAYRQTRTRPMPPAVLESCQALADVGQIKQAGVVRSYFEDLFASLEQCRRVLADGAPCWLVIGGARLKNVYVPSDLIMADRAEACGFEVLDVRIARRLTPTGRKLGRLLDVAPRESVLILRAGG
ncbi:MAG: hypothetical protein GY778_02900 [bacterium]|nr:hypothetical protein [bacterium]